MSSRYHIPTKRSIAYDDLLVHHVGEFSRYQKYIYFGVCIIAIAAAFNNMGIVFIAGTPEHWCHIPELDHLNLTDHSLRNLTIPKNDEGVYESCWMYDRNYTSWGEEDVRKCMEKGCSQNSTVYCPSGWTYSTEEYTSTVVSQVRKAHQSIL